MRLGQLASQLVAHQQLGLFLAGIAQPVAVESVVKGVRAMAQFVKNSVSGGFNVNLSGIDEPESLSPRHFAVQVTTAQLGVWRDEEVILVVLISLPTTSTGK